MFHNMCDIKVWCSCSFTSWPFICLSSSMFLHVMECIEISLGLSIFRWVPLEYWFLLLALPYEWIYLNWSTSMYIYLCALKLPVLTLSIYLALISFIFFFLPFFWCFFCKFVLYSTHLGWYSELATYVQKLLIFRGGLWNR